MEIFLNYCVELELNKITHLMEWISCFVHTMSFYLEYFHLILSMHCMLHITQVIDGKNLGSIDFNWHNLLNFFQAWGRKKIKFTESIPITFLLCAVVEPSSISKHFLSFRVTRGNIYFNTPSLLQRCPFEAVFFFPPLEHCFHSTDHMNFEKETKSKRSYCVTISQTFIITVQCFRSAKAQGKLYYYQLIEHADFWPLLQRTLHKKQHPPMINCKNTMYSHIPYKESWVLLTFTLHIPQYTVKCEPFINLTGLTIRAMKSKANNINFLVLYT